jgi:hypothetical protein
MGDKKSFVAAAAPSVRQHICGMVNKEGEKYYTYKQVNNLLLDTVDKYLTSVGVGLIKDKKPDSSILKRYETELFKLVEFPAFENCEIIVDSAGYQVQTPGYFTRDTVPDFIDIYTKEFIDGYNKYYDRAFSLDLAPGYSHCPFKSWEDMKNLNVRSYGALASKPKHIKDKLIYIHHFRTPKLYKIYRELLFDRDLSDGFQHFGTGGLVSMRNGKDTPPCVMYVIPLIDIISKVKSKDCKKLSFHALGDTEFKSILAHCFFEHHIKKLYDIDFEVTYDSSTIFKTISLGRFTYILDRMTNVIDKLPLKSEIIHNMWKERGTYEDVYIDEVNDCVKDYGMLTLESSTTPIYRKDDGKFNSIYYTYGIFQMFKLYKDIQDICRSCVKSIYPLYESGNILEFNLEVEKLLVCFNSNKYTPIINSRVNTISNSLKMLENLDLDYSTYIVDKYMASGECNELPNNDKETVSIQNI